MPEERELELGTFRTAPSSVFYSFMPIAAQTDMLCMSPVGVSSADADISSSASENFEWTMPDRQIARVLVDLFKEIPQVKSICAKFDADQIRVWTLLESYDRDAREKVYEKEIEICRVLRIRDFDFRVSSEDLMSAEELERAGSRVIYRRH